MVASKNTLSDQEVWDVLDEAGLIIGEKHGTTDLGDGTLNTV